MLDNKEKWDKVIKVVAVVSLVLSLFIALLPCFVFQEDVLADVVADIDLNAPADWSDDTLSWLVMDELAPTVADTLNSGLISNMARSAVVLLGAGVVYTYSSNMYLSMMYFIILLIGIPVLTLVSAGFHIWGKKESKKIIACIFTGVNLILCITIFLTIPGLFVTIVKNTVPDMASLYFPMLRTLVFQVMIRSMGIGFWGFIALQIIALGCSIYRLGNAETIETVVKKQSTGVVSQKAGVLMGLSGMYAGAEVPLDGTEIILGRDAAEAQLVIESPKVSRRHCKVVYDTQKKQYIVTDYSTNGTFVGKRRLTKGTAEILPAGSILNIGDSKNSFRLQ